MNSHAIIGFISFVGAFLAVGCVSGNVNEAYLKKEIQKRNDIGIELSPNIEINGPDVPQSVLDEKISRQILENSSRVHQILTPELMKAYAAASAALKRLSVSERGVGQPEEYLIGFGKAEEKIYISFIPRYVRNSTPYTDEYREFFDFNDSYFYGFGDVIPLLVTINSDDMSVLSIEPIIF